MLHKKSSRGIRGARDIKGTIGGKGARGAKDIWGTGERGGLFGSKHYWILSQFLGDYTREVYGRELVGKVPMSQKGIALALRELENQALLRATTRGRSVFYGLNPALPETRDFLAMAEHTRKTMFLSKHLRIKQLFRDDERIVGVFGSYAKGIESKASDVDIFVVGDKKEKDYDSIGKIWGLDVHLFHFSPKEFRRLLARKDNLMCEIAESHVLVFGIERFIRLVWEQRYGFDRLVY